MNGALPETGPVPPANAMLGASAFTSASSRAAADQALRFAGYAALFDTPDAGRDTIQRGAFARTLADRRDPLPILWQHRTDLRVGWVESVAEDDRGLRVVAQLDTPFGAPGRALTRRTVSGLSFGYRVRASRPVGTLRQLLDVDLFEISLVTYPMQLGARVHLIT